MRIQSASGSNAKETLTKQFEPVDRQKRRGSLLRAAIRHLALGAAALLPLALMGAVSIPNANSAPRAPKQATLRVNVSDTGDNSNTHDDTHAHTNTGLQFNSLTSMKTLLFLTSCEEISPAQGGQQNTATKALLEAKERLGKENVCPRASPKNLPTRNEEIWRFGSE